MMKVPQLGYFRVFLGMPWHDSFRGFLSSSRGLKDGLRPPELTAGEGWAMPDWIGRLFLDSLDNDSAACRRRTLFIGFRDYNANLVLPVHRVVKPRPCATTGVATEKAGLSISNPPPIWTERLALGRMTFRIALLLAAWDGSPAMVINLSPGLPVSSNEDISAVLSALTYHHGIRICGRDKNLWFICSSIAVGAFSTGAQVAQGSGTYCGSPSLSYLIHWTFIVP
jgi:hypothetical protein